MINVQKRRKKILDKIKTREADWNNYKKVKKKLRHYANKRTNLDYRKMQEMKIISMNI